MNKEILEQVGFEKEVEAVKQGKCPFCGKKVDVAREFRNSLSRREYAISGLCQDCQDKVFGIAQN